MTTTYPTETPSMVCPPWCVSHRDDDDETVEGRIHDGAEHHVGDKSGLFEGVIVNLETGNLLGGELGPHEVRIELRGSNAELTMVDARRLADLLLELADIIDRGMEGTS